MKKLLLACLLFLNCSLGFACPEPLAFDTEFNEGDINIYSMSAIDYFAGKNLTVVPINDYIGKEMFVKKFNTATVKHCAGNNAFENDYLLDENITSIGQGNDGYEIYKAYNPNIMVFLSCDEEGTIKRIQTMANIDLNENNLEGIVLTLMNASHNNLMDETMASIINKAVPKIVEGHDIVIYSQPQNRFYFISAKETSQGVLIDLHCYRIENEFESISKKI